MYLLDTNIIVFLFKNNENVAKKLTKIGLNNCYISEITIAELKYGAEKSNRPVHHTKIVEEFIGEVSVIPIIDVLDVYAKEKVRLEKIGNRIDDFDLLIGASAIVTGLVLVTNNVAHLQRMDNIIIEDWTK
ncbi:MAG: PIN domain-containing protein [Sphingobacteriales bacterium]|nr:PIN domain-containing protein [Sphingobacteriales bacterium]